MKTRSVSCPSNVVGSYPAPVDPCPVSALAREAKLLIDRYNAADNIAVEAAQKIEEANRTGAEEDRRDAVTKHTGAQRQMDQCFDFLDGVASRATYLRAESARGALFQLFLISDKINSLSSLVIDESDRRKANQIEAATDRMLYSVAEFIEHTFGVSPADTCGEFYMSAKLNPHKSINEAA